MQVITHSSYEEPFPEVLWEGLPSFKGLQVFVKPNLVTPPSPTEFQSCTHVTVTAAVVQQILNHGADSVWVGDCGFKNQWEKTLTLSGYSQLRKLFPGKVRLIGLQEKSNFHRFTLLRSEPGYLSLFGARISDHVLNCDCIVDVPKLKTHSMAGMTGAIKNLMGIMAQKGSMHPRGSAEILHKRLADLYFLLRDRVVFCVMDGIVGSEYCEQTGCPVNSQILMSSADPWEMDCVAASIIGISPSKIGYLNYIKSRLNKTFPETKGLPQITPYECSLAYR